MIVARRVYLYGIAFATIWMLVNGLAGLLQVALVVLVQAVIAPNVIAPGNGFTDEVSFYGALTGIGLVTWIVHWGLAIRAATRDPLDECRSALRKLYLYGVLFVGGLIFLYQFRQLVVDMFGVVVGTVTNNDLATGELIEPLAMLTITGLFWAYHLRGVQRDRDVVPEVGAAATIRRWCFYGLAWVGLMVLLFGMAGLLARLLDLAIPPEGRAADSGRWLALDMSSRIASAVTGLIVWLGAWTWTSRAFARATGPDPERDSVLRKVYLYGVLLLSVSWTVWNVAQALYLLMRSVLIPSQAGALWSTVRGDLGDTVANVLVFGMAWAYHAQVVKREAAAAPEHQRQSAIRWIYGYIVALVGAITFGAGLSGTLATLLDLLANPGVTGGEYWWQERLSLFATMIVVGLPIWLISWFRLQREVVASVARRSLARRIYLFLALGITVLTLLASGAYTLYQILRVALGERWTASNTSDLIDAASAAIVAGLLLAYHLRVFQGDAGLAAEDASATPAIPTPHVDQSAPAPTMDEMVTLLVVRPSTSEDAEALRERVQASLPAGWQVETMTVARSEAERLLGRS
jgi:hypothetical protein